MAIRAVTENVFAHPYTPDKVGRDTIHHDARRPSHILPSARHMNENTFHRETRT